MSPECGQMLSSCRCGKPEGHPEAEHACADDDGTGCGGRWMGEAYTPSLRITQFPFPPPEEWYDRYKVKTLAALLLIASAEMQRPPSVSVRRGGIKYDREGRST